MSKVYRAAHSLNLVGLPATETYPCMITFFGTVQRNFMVFCGSTTRWDKFITVIKITLKANCETRWSSKKHAVSAPCKNIKDIYLVLQDISNDMYQDSIKSWCYFENKLLLNFFIYHIYGMTFSQILIELIALYIKKIHQLTPHIK